MAGYITEHARYKVKIESANVNDEGANIAPGKGSGRNTYYCGRFFGAEVLPGTDGHCGPGNGLNCKSCKRFKLAQQAKELSKELSLKPANLASTTGSDSSPKASEPAKTFAPSKHEARASKPPLHEHPLQKTPLLKDHGCDVGGRHCRQFGTSYRCETCDFDVCQYCFAEHHQHVDSASAGQSALSHAAIRRIITNAIRQGVPRFNRGDAEGCFLLYCQAAAEIADDSGGEFRSLLIDAQRRASSQRKASDRAWTMRRALDTVLKHIDEFDPHSRPVCGHSVYFSGGV